MKRCSPSLGRCSTASSPRSSSPPGSSSSAFPPSSLAFAAAAAPVDRASATQRWISAAAAAWRSCPGLNTILHFARIPDEADADAIIDEIPEGKRVIAVTWSNHRTARHPARDVGPSSRLLPSAAFGPDCLLVREVREHARSLRLGKVPPVVPGGMEWDARKYDLSAPFARYWDTVLVRTPDEDPDGDPRARTFRDAAPLVRLTARHGRFWLYDASALSHRAPPRPTGSPASPFE